MAEFERATLLTHICRIPYNLTSNLPAAAKIAKTENQQAVKTMMTIARVKVTRSSMWRGFGLLEDPFLSWFLSFRYLTRDITIVVYDMSTMA